MNRQLTGVKTVYPLKDMETIHAMHRYLLGLAQNANTIFRKRLAYRDWLYFALGINLGFRGGDLSELVWGQLIEQHNGHFVLRANDETNLIHAEKTGKAHLIVLNPEARKVIRYYIQQTAPLGTDFSENTPVFFSKRPTGTSEAVVEGHVDCDNMGRMLKKAAKALGIRQNICTHSLRKTFGYHYFKATGDIVTLQKVFGHSSPAITLAYIGMDAEEITAAYNRKPDTCIELGVEAEGEIELPEEHVPAKSEEVTSKEEHNSVRGWKLIGFGMESGAERPDIAEDSFDNTKGNITPIGKRAFG